MFIHLVRNEIDLLTKTSQFSTILCIAVGYYANPSVIFFLILCVQALRHCETYMGKKLIMNWYTGAKVKPGQTDDSNYQDEEAADPEVEVSYT